MARSVGAGLRGEREGLAEIGLGAGQQRFQGGIVQAAQHQDLAAGEQGAVQREGRVFRGGADQDDGAVLDHGQKAVLLGAVEAVDFVHEQQGDLAGLAAARTRRRRRA